MEADILRIADVNVNRLREALRVIEDYARFALNDGNAASAVKHCRHELQSIVQALGADGLLTARDIAGDVGRDLKTPGELRRDSTEDVVRAAFGRVSEAARVLGEFGKIVSEPAAAAAEALRYRAYELEQRVVLRGKLRRRFRDVRLYVLLTEALCRGPWLATAEAAIRGGAGCLQLREKVLPDGELLRRARALRELTTSHGVLLAINDRPDIARLARADVVHVGQDDLTVHAHAGAVRGGAGRGAGLPGGLADVPERHEATEAHRRPGDAAHRADSDRPAAGGDRRHHGAQRRGDSGRRRYVHRGLRGCNRRG